MRAGPLVQIVLATLLGAGCIELVPIAEVNLEIVVKNVPATATSLRVEVTPEGKEAIARQPKVAAEVKLFLARIPAGGFTIVAVAKDKDGKEVAWQTASGTATSAPQTVPLTLEATLRRVSFVAGAMFPMGEHLLVAAVTDSLALHAVSAAEDLEVVGGWLPEATILHPSGLEALVLANGAGDGTYALGVVRAPLFQWIPLHTGVRPGRFGYIGNTIWAMASETANSLDGNLVLVRAGENADAGDFAECPQRKVRGPVATSLARDWIVFETQGIDTVGMRLDSEGNCSPLKAESGTFGSLAVAEDSDGFTFTFLQPDPNAGGRDVFVRYVDQMFRSSTSAKTLFSQRLASRSKASLTFATGGTELHRYDDVDLESPMSQVLDCRGIDALGFLPTSIPIVYGSCGNRFFLRPKGTDMLVYAPSKVDAPAMRLFDDRALALWGAYEGETERDLLLVDALSSGEFQSLRGFVWDFASYVTASGSQLWFATPDGLIGPAANPIPALPRRTYGGDEAGLVYIDRVTRLATLRPEGTDALITLSSSPARSIAPAADLKRGDSATWWVAFEDGRIARVGVPRGTP